MALPTQQKPAVGFSRALVVAAILIGAYPFGPVRPSGGFSLAGPVFERIGAREGLSRHNINGITQDRHGFIWLATESGLLRYDGYTFQAYCHVSLTPPFPEQEGYERLLLSRSGDLWVITAGGALWRFKPQLETWHKAPAFPAAAVGSEGAFCTALAEDKSGRLWVGVHNRGVVWFDLEAGRSGLVALPPAAAGSEPLYVTSLCVDEAGDLWAGTTRFGLFRRSAETGVIAHFAPRPGDSESLGGKAVAAIACGPGGARWVATRTGGLQNLQVRDGKVRITPFPWADGQAPVPAKVPQCLLIDRRGRLWVGDSAGLTCLDPRSGQVQVHRVDPKDPESLVSNNIQTLFEDRAGTLWIGTWGNALVKLDQRRLTFSHFRSDPDTPNSLSSSQVQCLVEDRAGTVWVGTIGGGVDCWDRTRGTIAQCPPWSGHPPDGADHSVVSLLADRSGGVWAAALSGKVFRLDRRRKRFQPVYDFAETPKRASYPYVMTQDDDGDVWVGVNPNRGLARFDLQGALEAFYPWPAASGGRAAAGGRFDIYALRPTGGGLLWVGTTAGLYLFDPGTGRWLERGGAVEIPAALKDKTIHCLHRGADGAWWFGTSSGLFQLPSQGGRFSDRSADLGVGGLDILGLVADERGELWLLSSRGIVRAGRRGRASRTYTVLDGLQSDVIAYQSFVRVHDGTVFAGGLNGLDGFCPDQAEVDPPAPPVALTGLQVLNQPVEVKTGQKAVLTRVPWETDLVELDYWQNVVTFEFAALSYGNPERNRYAYQLEGFNPGWVQGGARRQATYTNLDPGEYRFRVKGAGENGVWNETGATLRLRIRPPFYRTGWFLALVAGGLLVAGGVGYFVGSRLLAKLIEHRQVSRFGKFKLLGRLGAGGTGEVFRAKDLSSGKVGALKIIHESVMSSDMQRAFLQEGLICEAIHHPNVTGVLARGAFRGRSYLFLEYVAGPSLQQLIARAALAPPQALAVAAALVDVVDEIHAHGVIHRDLKPDNILFTPGFDPAGTGDFPTRVAKVKEHVRVLDFGLARFIARQTLTRIDIDTGTPLFLPPEYFWNRLIPQPGGDFYALGVILYLMLAGAPPYPADHDDVYQTIFRIVHEEATDLRMRTPALPPALADFVMALIAKDPARRLQDPTEIRPRMEALFGEVSDG